MHLTSSYKLSNESAFNVVSESHFLNIWHDFRKTFRLLTHFMIWLPVLTHQRTWIKMVFVWCVHYLIMTSFVTLQSRFLNIWHDFRKISCLLSSFVSQKVCSATRARTHTKTDTKVDTEDTLSGFQECLIQLIIKDRCNKRKTMDKKHDVRRDSNPQLRSWNTLGDRLANHSAIPTLNIVGNQNIVSKQYYVTWWWTHAVFLFWYVGSHNVRVVSGVCVTHNA